MMQNENLNDKLVEHEPRHTAVLTLCVSEIENVYGVQPLVVVFRGSLRANCCVCGHNHDGSDVLLQDHIQLYSRMVYPYKTLAQGHGCCTISEERRHKTQMSDTHVIAHY